MAKKKVELQTLLVADEVIEAKDGKKSIIGIFDKIFVNKLPASHNKMWLFISLLGEAEVADKLTIRIVRPNDQEASKLEVDFNFGNEGKANVMINLQGFPIQEVGSHLIIIEHSGKEIGSYQIDAVKVKEQGETGQVIN